MISVVDTSILFISPEVEEKAAPALAAAKVDPELLAVAEFTVNENCWLSVTLLKKLTRTEKVLLPSSAAESAKPVNAADDPPATSAKFVFTSNNAMRLKLPELATDKVNAVNSVVNASTSALPPPS